MKNIIFALLVLLFSGTFVSAQWTVSKTPEIIQYEPDWATDILVSNTEPFGKLTGVAKANGTIYLAVPDTGIISGKSIVIFKSTNYGATWTTPISYTGSAMPQRSKMVRSGLDSVYYLYLINNIIYCLNVENTLNFNTITTVTYRDFDVVASSTGGLYVVADQLTSSAIPRYSSANGFATISQTGSVSTGSFPRMYMSGLGDTLILLFYSLAADTLTGTIRQGRYRETSPGQISSVGFIDVVPSGTTKGEMQPVMYGRNVWVIYTQGTTGAININCMISTNSGANYASPVTLAGNPNTDEYYFEARHFTTGSGGLDIAYYSDSLQSGTPTNNTDKMLYCYANISAPGTFSGLTQFSQHPPGWSARGYIPAMIEIYNTSDVGVAWVGLDGTNKRVYWDRYSAVTGIQGNKNEIPIAYTLKQNYPNPFNPTTKIEFAIPKDEFVSLKVFDMLGREAAVLVSKNMKTGNHTIGFNASKLSSGVYFYRLDAGRYSETKKMMLVK